MSTKISPLAGRPAQPAQLVDVAKLVAAYYSRAARSRGCRRSAWRSAPPGIAARRSTQASTRRTCSRSRRRSVSIGARQGIDGPLFLGIDTHALSGPAFETALEVLAANGVDVLIAQDGEYTPTPAVSHAILVHNRGRETRARRRHRRHAVAQSARQRRLQVQPAQRRPCRHRRHGLDRSQGERAARRRACATCGASPSIGRGARRARASTTS